MLVDPDVVVLLDDDPDVLVDDPDVVLLDDELLFEQSGVELGQGPQAIRVEVPRAGMLRLRCLSEGDALASGRHGNWIAPRYWFSGRMP